MLHPFAVECYIGICYYVAKYIYARLISSISASNNLSDRREIWIPYAKEGEFELYIPRRII